MELANILAEVRDAMAGYEAMQQQNNALEFNEYLRAFNDRNYDMAAKCAPTEIKPYMLRLLQLDTQVVAMETELSQEIALQRINEYVRAGGIHIFTEDASNLIESVVDKRLAFEAILPAVESSLSFFCRETSHIIDSEAFERFLAAFGPFRSIAEEKIIELLIVFDEEWRFCVDGPFEQRYVAAVYEMQNKLLSEQYTGMIERELSNISGFDIEQEVFPESEQEIAVFTEVIRQMARQKVEEVELLVLGFCRKPVFKASETMVFPFVENVRNALTELRQLQCISGFVGSVDFYASSERTVLESLRALSRIGSQKIPPHCGLSALQSLGSCVQDEPFFQQVCAAELATVKEKFYARFYDFTQDFSNLLDKTSPCIASSKVFILKRATEIFDEIEADLEKLGQIPLDNDTADNLRYSMIAGVLDKTRDIIAKVAAELPPEEATALANVAIAVHRQCQRHWQVNKQISASMMESLEAYAPEYRSLCQEVRRYWIMANYGIILLEKEAKRIQSQ